MTGTPENPLLNLGIPKGADASGGSGGEPVFSLVDTYDLSTGAMQFETTDIKYSEILCVIADSNLESTISLYVNNVLVSNTIKNSAAYFRATWCDGYLACILMRNANQTELLALAHCKKVGGTGINSIKAVVGSALNSGKFLIYGW